MSYQERKTIVQIASGLVVLAAYCIYALGQYQAGVAGPNDLKPWAVNILIFIGIGILASIVIQIVFHIFHSVTVAVREKIRDVNVEEKEIEKSIQAELVEDEMDKLIELKSMRVGLVFAGAGFVLGLISLSVNYPPALMLNILFISFSLGSIFDGAAHLYYYRKGV